MVLIDEDPDYLSIAPDVTFRSRSRYQDEETGEWRSETEVIESAVGARRAVQPGRAVRRVRGGGARARPACPTSRRAPRTCWTWRASRPRRASAWASAAATRTSAPPMTGPRARTMQPPADAGEAARRLYDLALTFQERSQLSEARLIEQFEIAAQPLAGRLGDQLILDDEDERLWFKGHGAFEAEVIPERDEEDEDEGRWVTPPEPRGAGPVLRPDRPVRRPRRDARRAVPGGRAG